MDVIRVYPNLLKLYAIPLLDFFTNRLQRLLTLKTSEYCPSVLYGSYEVVVDLIGVMFRRLDRAHALYRTRSAVPRSKLARKRASFNEFYPTVSGQTRAEEKKYLIDSLKMWAMGKPEEWQQIEQQISSRYLQFSPSIGEAYNDHKVGLTELVGPVVHESDLMIKSLKQFEDERAKFETECQTDTSIHCEARASDIVAYYQMLDELSTAYNLHDRPIFPSDRIVKLAKEYDERRDGQQINLEELKTMPLAELEARLQWDKRLKYSYGDEQKFGEILSILMERFAANPLVLDDLKYGIEAESKKTYLDALEHLLAGGWRPTKEDPTYSRYPSEISLEWSEYKDVQSSYPLVFEVFYRDNLERLSDNEQFFRGVYSLTHDKPFTRELTWEDFGSTDKYSWEWNIQVENPEAKSKITQFYLSVPDQDSRLWLLTQLAQADIGNPVIPKESLFPEDLALLRDYKITPKETLTYSPDTITADQMAEYARTTHKLYTRYLSEVSLHDPHTAIRLAIEAETLSDSTKQTP